MAKTPWLASSWPAIPRFARKAFRHREFLRRPGQEDESKYQERASAVFDALCSYLVQEVSLGRTAGKPSPLPSSELHAEMRSRLWVSTLDGVVFFCAVVWSVCVLELGQ